MYNYDTVAEALQALKDRGFTLDFNLAFDQIKCDENGTCLSPEAFEIVEHYRFEGNSDPSDEAVVYAIASHNGDIKGVLISAYGMYNDEASENMIKKLTVNE